MRYIDFDGVILDTHKELFKEWNQQNNLNELTEKEKIEYVKNSDWERILNESFIINDSIYILKNMNPNTSAILTKVHSLENEGTAKIRYLKLHGIKQPIIIVPYNVRKVDVVDAYKNILIDDNLNNLLEWKNAGGYPMFFDQYASNTDPWGMYNHENIQRVLRINARQNKKN